MNLTPEQEKHLQMIYDRAFAGADADGYYDAEYCHRYAAGRVRRERERLTALNQEGS